MLCKSLLLHVLHRPFSVVPCFGGLAQCWVAHAAAIPRCHQDTWSYCTLSASQHNCQAHGARQREAKARMRKRYRQYHSHLTLAQHSRLKMLLWGVVDKIRRVACHAGCCYCTVLCSLAVRGRYSRRSLEQTCRESIYLWKSPFTPHCSSYLLGRRGAKKQVGPPGGPCRD
jgi:hypothetical protein